MTFYGDVTFFLRVLCRSLFRGFSNGGMALGAASGT